VPVDGTGRGVIPTTVGLGWVGGRVARGGHGVGDGPPGTWDGVNGDPDGSEKHGRGSGPPGPGSADTALTAPSAATRERVTVAAASRGMLVFMIWLLLEMEPRDWGVR